MPSKNDFKTIYTEYYQRIVQYLTKIAGPNDAEDIAQDVFDKINRNLEGFKGKSKLSTWIYRIATNTAIDKFRSAAHKQVTKHNAIEDDMDSEAQSFWVENKSPATDQAVIRKEMSECVNEFIDKLPPDYKTIIVLSELEDLSNKEIAEILGISLENVKVRLHRAKAKLKTLLNDGCDFYLNEQNTLACDRKSPQILSKLPK